MSGEPDGDGGPPPLPAVPIRGVMLVPELAEVYLLLDNLSGAANKTLPDLSAEPAFRDGSGGWMEQLCAIRWPPRPDEEQDEALNAAKLVLAKDALNREAWPASSASIAFTLMLSGESAGIRRRDRRLAWTRQDEAAEPERTGNPRDRLCNGTAYSRQSLAAMAYPALDRGMHKSRILYLLLNWFLVLALLATCLLSWQVATGVSLLNRVDTLVHTAQVARLANARAVTTATTASDPTDVMAADPQLRIPIANLMQWVDDNRWLASLVGASGQEPFYRSGRPPPNDRMSNVEWAAVLIGVLAGTVLPICYGVLGASAAVVRNLAARMNANTLMPRDLVLGFVQLGMGALIGACVGLFVTSDGDAASDTGLLGSVHLSGSALCFLAGFGVEGVFRALESFVGRVFPVGSAAPTPSAPQGGGAR